MCTRHFEGVPQAIMEPEVFEAALPDLRTFECVFFVGWGEPLMSPYALDYLKALGGKEHSRGLSTNGILLEGELAERLLREGAYSINVSIDAGTPQTYARIRGRDRFEKVVSNLSRFSRLKKEFGSKTHLTWVFVLMRSNYRELPEAVRVAADSGVDQFAIKQLESGNTREVLEEAFYSTGYAPGPTSEETKALEAVLDSCRTAAEGRIHLVVHPVVHGVEFWGLNEPFFKLFIDHRGRVTPCSFISPNDTKPYTGEEFQEEWVLGNVMDSPLSELISTEKAIDFQRKWLTGAVPEACRGCLRIPRMGEDRLCNAL